jgi:5'-nucleotidase/UDP-sugar diphosphatase
VSFALSSSVSVDTVHKGVGLGVCALASAVLMGCGGSDEPTYKPLELNIAHINDHHSQLDAFAATELTLDGVATQVELGGFARQTALFKSVAGTQNLLKSMRVMPSPARCTTPSSKVRSMRR